MYTAEIISNTVFVQVFERNLIRAAKSWIQWKNSVRALTKLYSYNQWMITRKVSNMWYRHYCISHSEVHVKPRAVTHCSIKGLSEEVLVHAFLFIPEHLKRFLSSFPCHVRFRMRNSCPWGLFICFYLWAICSSAWCVFIVVCAAHVYTHTNTWLSTCLQCISQTPFQCIHVHTYLIETIRKKKRLLLLWKHSDPLLDAWLSFFWVCNTACLPHSSKVLFVRNSWRGH